MNFGANVGNPAIDGRRPCLGGFNAEVELLSRAGDQIQTASRVRWGGTMP